MCGCKLNTFSAAPRRKAKSQPLKAVRKKEVVVKHGNAGSEKTKEIYAITVKTSQTRKNEVII